MPFIELEPPRKAAGIGTGVRLSITDRLGLRISLAGDALEAILGGRFGTSADGSLVARSGAGADAAGGGGDATARFRVLIDRDPALPRLRIVLAPDGRFRLGKPPLGNRWRFLTLGRETGLPMAPLKAADCTWEAVDGQQAIDIDLPRELRSVRQHQPVGQPSTSNGPRPSPVTLPGRAKERV